MEDSHAERLNGPGLPERLADFRTRVLPALSDNWLRHSLALSYLESLRKDDCASWRTTACGPSAFAVLAGIAEDQMESYFPNSSSRSWTNRREMEHALHRCGMPFSRQGKAWPRLGLCLIHWKGPWTEAKFPAAVLQRTHWVAVVEDYVFDVNWRGWLPRENWEDVVVTELIRGHANAVGWQPLTAYELFI
jgi:hypothetical protein